MSEDPGASGQFVMNELSNNESLPKAGESPGVTIFPVPVDNELHVKIDDTAGKDPDSRSEPWVDRLSGLLFKIAKHKYVASADWCLLPAGGRRWWISEGNKIHKTVEDIMINNLNGS